AVRPVRGGRQIIRRCCAARPLDATTPPATGPRRAAASRGTRAHFPAGRAHRRYRTQEGALVRSARLAGSSSVILRRDEARIMPASSLVRPKGVLTGAGGRPARRGEIFAASGDGLFEQADRRLTRRTATQRRRKGIPDRGWGLLDPADGALRRDAQGSRGAVPFPLFPRDGNGNGRHQTEAIVAALDTALGSQACEGLGDGRV